MQKKWNLLPKAPETFIQSHPELPQTAVNLLYHRSLTTQEEIDEFLNPDYSEDVHDPFLFLDIKKAIRRIFKSVELGEKIAVYGDYDADGVSGAVILKSFFNALDYKNVSVFLPHREIDGYGINKKALNLLNEEGVKLLISCDCGISNYEEIEFANELGIDCIITDHHAVPEKLPPAFAIIHPKLERESYPGKNLAGGAVAFKLVQALLETHKKNNETLQNGETHEKFEKWLLDMVALSNVSDMVPLLGEARTLTKYGLIVMNKTKRIGLQKLLLEARLMHEDGSLKREIDSHTISFHIAPRINAAGRMNHASVAYNLLMTESPVEAIDLAFELNQNNKERQQMTDQYVSEASIQVKEGQKDKPILFLCDDGWNTGILGLVAGRIKEKFNKPAIAMAKRNGSIMGSGRSIDAFNMIQAMQEKSEMFEKFGGHPMACGFTLSEKTSLEQFKEQMLGLFARQTENKNVAQTLDIDTEVNLEEINWEFYDILQKFEPFGQANQKPKYLAKNLTIVKLERVGKLSNHLRVMVKHNTNVIRKTIGWQLCNENAGDNIDWSKKLKIGDKIDMVFEVDINEWNGNRELQLTIIDLKKA